MRRISYSEAIAEAQLQEMQRDEKVFLMGLVQRDPYGSAFGQTKGISSKLGTERIIDVPVSENGYVGAGVGAAITGMRPVVELQFSDFITIAMDQVVQQAANLRYMFGGQIKVPMVLRAPTGAYLSAAGQHSHSLESWFSFIPGIKVVVPSDAYDAKGLLTAAIRDDNFVLYLEHKKLYDKKMDVPEEAYTIPIGTAAVKRKGSDLTLVAWSFMVSKALDAASILEKKGISVEVVDLRSVSPLDEETILSIGEKDREASGPAGNLPALQRGHRRVGARCGERVRPPGCADPAYHGEGRAHPLRTGAGELRPAPDRGRRGRGRAPAGGSTGGLRMAVPVLMPKLGLTMEVGTVASWRKKEGEQIESGEPLLDVETDKIVTEVHSPRSGVLLKVLVPEGTEVKVQTVLAVVGDPGEDVSAFTTASPSDAREAVPPSAATSPKPEVAEPRGEDAKSEGGAPRITPRARRILTERGYSPSDLAAMGKTRITESDVQEFLAARETEGPGALARESSAAPPGGSGELRPMSRIERIVAERMTQSFRDIPQFSLRLVADVTHLFEMLPRLRQAAGAAVSVNDILLRAVAIAISRSPQVQCHFRPEGIFQPAGVNLGIAVASGRDLVVPVIHDAQDKKLAQVCREAADLAERARTRRLNPEDLSGGTFTVSNLGMFGVTSFVPIVNPGEGAILGVGAVHDAVRTQGESLTMGKAIELSLVCDHRSVSGATGAEFCRTLKTVLESPGDEAW